MSNSTITQLDAAQAFKRSYSETDDAIRTIPAEATSYAIEVSAADGDTVMVIGSTDGTTSGTQKVIKLASDGSVRTKSLGQLVNVDYDYLSVNYASATQEVYTYKTGGSGGSTVATVTLNYTDATKASLSNAAVT